MEHIDNTDIIYLAVANYMQISQLRINAACQLEESPRLTIRDRKNVQTIKLAEMHTKRIFQTLSYLLNPSSSAISQKIESYAIEDLMNGILSEFERLASTYMPLSVSFVSRLKNTGIISLSKIHFEFIILNLLYCCIKPLQDKICEPIKINVSVSETKEHIVFHIYDSNKLFNPTEVNVPTPDLLFSIEQSNLDSAADFIALSVRMAQRSAEDMNGKMSISSLKASNRYDICLPKYTDISQYKMNTPVRYIPTYSYYNEILADIKLEYVRTRKAESFKGEFEGVRLL